MGKSISLHATTFAGLLTLAACSHSSSEAITDIAPELKSDGFVSYIKINAVPDDVSPSFQGSLGTALQQGLARCATGTHPLWLEVTVTRFRAENAAMTILVGSSNAIEGAAKLVEPNAGPTVGDYDITTSVGGGGVIAAVAMADATRSMTQAFASDVCKKAFGHRPDFSDSGSATKALRLAPISYLQPIEPDAPPSVPASTPEPANTQPWHESPSQ